MRLKVLLAVILFSVLFSLLFVFDKENNGGDKREPEEKPVIVVSKEEREVEIRKEARIASLIHLKKTNNQGYTSYADGKISGIWSLKQFLSEDKCSYGYKTIYSAYDIQKDIIYAISHAGHLYRIDRDERDPKNTRWTIKNIKQVFSTPSQKRLLLILNHKDSESRMIRCYGGKLQYSDDEGSTWNNAGNGILSEDTDCGEIVIHNGEQELYVLAKSGPSYMFFISQDGKAYRNSQFSLKAEDFDVRLVKPCNTENIYVIARQKSDGTIFIHRKTLDDDDFKLIHHDASINTSGISRAFGTCINDKVHLYISHGNGNIYHSTNEGLSWRTTHSGVFMDRGKNEGDRNARTVHPLKPNYIFRGYFDVYYSGNYGIEEKSEDIKDFGLYLGWDVHHMKMYKKKDGSYFHLVGNDYGLFISYVPEEKLSYLSLNNTAPTQMVYDMEVSDPFGVVYTALQDRGTRAFINKDVVETNEMISTDGLRVCLANNDMSVWTIMYYGDVVHNQNFILNPYVKNAHIALGGSWWTAPMRASPLKTEDAVYLAKGSQLMKLLFDKNSQSIVQTKHPFNFTEVSGYSITGFDYSALNKKLWYVSVEDGRFYRSSDGGETFTKTTYEGKMPKAELYSTRSQHIIKTSRLDSNTVFFAGVGNVFLISKDKGKTFKNHNNALDVYRVRDFDMSPDEKFIYAACGTAGAWVFSVEDDRWYEMEGDDVPYVDFTSVHFSAARNMIQFGTYGCGVLDFKLKASNNTLIAPYDVKIAELSTSVVKLEWKHSNLTTEGYSIERSKNLITVDRSKVIPDNKHYYSDTTVREGTIYYYRIRCIRGEEAGPASVWLKVSVPFENNVDKTAWKIIDASSADYVHYAVNIFDDDERTIWKSDAKDDYPYRIIIDLGKEYIIDGIIYDPGPYGNAGIIKEFLFFIGNDYEVFGDPTGKKKFLADGKTRFSFAAESGRYLCIIALSGMDEKSLARIGEISCVGTEKVSLNRKFHSEGIKLFPNPFNQQLSLQIPKDGKTFHTIKIINMEGKEVFTQEINQSQTIVHLDQIGHLEKGVYIVHLIGKDSHVRQSVLKK